ncbi:MAG: DUF4411 family protein [Gemmatimonadetes bacterium]|nr:DUF4411 family protein [Gemmatimonadota bacterium]
MAYLLDANVFIEGKKRYYGFDICPGFWDWIANEDAAGRAKSIEAVRDELLEREDDLTAWARARPAGFFLRPDAPTLPALASLAEWVRRQRYRPAAITEFLESADYYLIAYAMAHGHSVVTHEVPSDAVKRVKIPEPCIAHGVEVISPFVMLRRAAAKFVLSPS